MDKKLGRRFHSSLLWLSLFSAVLLIVSCASTTIQFPDFDPSVIKDKEYMKEKDDLFICIHPIVNRNEMDNYFKTDLASHNILAVYISIENRSETYSYIVSKEDISLYINKKRSDEQYDTSNTLVGDDSTAKTVDVLGAVLVSPVLLFIGPGMISHAGTTRHNLLSKEIVPFKTLFPGQSIGGFTYFKTPEEGISSSSFVFEVKVKELDSESITAINFSLDMKGTYYETSKNT
jgi:hypothetical protein